MTNTGVFLTGEELAEAKRLADEAARTPAINPFGVLPMGRSLSSMAWDRVQRQIHSYALAHGLPEIPGYYGLLANGELVRT